MRLRAALFAAAVAIGLGAGPRAQQTQPTFRARTDLVRIDVVAVDAAGAPVRNLTQADFTLLDGKTPRPIALFEEVAQPIRPPDTVVLPPSFPRDVADNQSPRAKRLVVLAVDDMVIRPYLDKARELARHVVSELGPGVLLALLTTSETVRMEVTEDSAAILAAIDRIGTLKESPVIRRRLGEQTSNPPIAGGDTSCHLIFLHQAAKTLAADELPRKVFLYFSPFCGSARTALPDPDNTAYPYGGGPLIDYLELVEWLRLANITLYALDPRGVLPFNLDQFLAPNIVSSSTAPTRSGFTTDMKLRSFSPVRISQEDLAAFTADTGGFAVTNSNDFDAGVARIKSDLEHYYVLGFYPDETKTRRYRAVDVKVNRPDLTVRFRPGYITATKPLERRNKDSLTAFSEGAVSDAGLPLRLFAAPTATTGSGVSAIVALEVRVPRAAMRQDASGLHDDLTAEILAMNTRTTKLAQRVRINRHITVPLAEWQSVTTVTYQVLATVDLPAAEYQFRVAARSAAAGAGGSAYIMSDLALARTPLALGGVLVGEDRAAGQVAAASSDRATTLPFTAVFDRTFAPDSRLRLWCRLLGSSRSAVTALRAELLSEDGSVVRHLDEPILPTKTRNDALDLTLNLVGVPQGAYRVRLTATAGAATATREISIVVEPVRSSKF